MLACVDVCVLFGPWRVWLGIECVDGLCLRFYVVVFDWCSVGCGVGGCGLVRHACVAFVLLCVVCGCVVGAVRCMPCVGLSVFVWCVCLVCDCR